MLRALHDSADGVIHRIDPFMVNKVHGWGPRLILPQPQMALTGARLTPVLYLSQPLETQSRRPDRSGLSVRAEARPLRYYLVTRRVRAGTLNVGERLLLLLGC